MKIHFTKTLDCTYRHTKLSHLQTILLLVSHGATVLAGSLPELLNDFVLDYSLLVPVVDGAVRLLLLFLRALMRERRSPQAHVPRGLGYVLRYMWIDVPVGGRK